MDVEAPTTPEVELADHDAATASSHAVDAHASVSDGRYVVIAAILAVITAGEVAASYIDLGPVFIPLLLFMMAVKFFIVASFFMHLRFDNKIFSTMFYGGLVVALVVYMGTLATFKFFDR